MPGTDLQELAIYQCIESMIAAAQLIVEPDKREKKKI